MIVGGFKKKNSKIQNFSENLPNFQKKFFEPLSRVKNGYQNPVEWLWCIVLT
jgi:hypothetical protein